MKYKCEDKTPLDLALGKIAEGASRRAMKQWVQEGRVLINGFIAKKLDITLPEGSIVSLGPKCRFLEEGIKVLFEDRDLVIIDKPEGLLSVASTFEKGETAHALLKKAYHPREVFVVHRIDQDTSGVMAFALSERGRDGMKELFFNHDLVREYIAIIEGQLKPYRGTWSSYLYEDRNYRVHTTDDPTKGQLATTHFRVEAHTKKFSRVRFTLETGRKNQIRVHCGEAGFPIVGDVKYGAAKSPIGRMALHARRLEFIHPMTKKKLSFTSPLPESFDKLVPGTNDLYEERKE